VYSRAVLVSVVTPSLNQRPFIEATISAGTIQT